MHLLKSRKKPGDFPILKPLSFLHRSSYGTLIGLMLVVLALGPYLRETNSPGGPMVTLILFIAFFAVMVSGESKKERILLNLVFLPAFFCNLLVLLTASEIWHHKIAILGQLLVCLVAILVLLGRLHRVRHFTFDTLLCGVSIYLLFGYFFFFLFDLLELTSPGSFLLRGEVMAFANPGRHLLHYPQLLYLSFVTLTTVGYGDIVPAWSLPRSLTVIEALTGQIYMSTLLAILVGSYLAERPVSGQALQESE